MDNLVGIMHNRADSFQTRVDVFHYKLKTWASRQCSDGLSYLHLLVQHIGDYIAVWGKHLGWGYGFFSAAAGEHLNK